MRKITENMIAKARANLERERAKIAETLTGYIADYDAKIELWEAVKHNTKKDGTEFASLKKSFTGAEVYNPYYTNDERDKRLQVWDHRMVNGHYDVVKDDIKISADPDALTDPARVIDRPFMTSYYMQNALELMQRIKEHVAQLKSLREEYNNELTVLNERFKTYSEAVLAAMVRLAESGTADQYNRDFSNYRIAEAVNKALHFAF